MQQDEAESEGFVEAAVSRVQGVALTWEPILPRSTWCQAVGALVDAISTKLVNDVMEMPSIGQDEAFAMANLIAKVTKLDDLFLPSRSTGKADDSVAAAGEGEMEIPSTAQYAASWLRLKYLSEVLQSNLNEVRYLWMESELSLYFTADEVVDLINLSFEDNAKAREVVKEVKHNPRPMQA